MNKNDIAYIINREASTIHSLGVEELHLFGSYAEDKATMTSDIDFAVKLKPSFKSILDFINVKHFLEDTFKVDIDLAPLDKLHSYLKPNIMQNIVRVL